MNSRMARLPVLPGFHNITTGFHSSLFAFSERNTFCSKISSYYQTPGEIISYFLKCENVCVCVEKGDRVTILALLLFTRTFKIILYKIFLPTSLSKTTIP